MSLEKKMERLEEIVHKMEKGDLVLEDSLKFFEEGVKITRECSEELQAAEKKVQLLLGKNPDGTANTEDFEIE